MEPETQNNLLEWDLEVFEETLSFCDLPVLQEPEADDKNYSISNQDFFEFSTTKTPEKLSPALDHFVVLSGNFINRKEVRSSPFYPRDSLLPSTSARLGNQKNCKNNNNKGSVPKKSPVQGKGRAIRRYKTLRVSKNVLIGFGRNVAPNWMELSDMKERQRKKAAERAGSAVAEEEKAVVSKSDRSLVAVDANGGNKTGKGHWGLLRTLRFRTYLTTVLNKASLGCFSAPAVRVA